MNPRERAKASFVKSIKQTWAPEDIAPFMDWLKDNEEPEDEISLWERRLIISQEIYGRWCGQESLSVNVWSEPDIDILLVRKAVKVDLSVKYGPYPWDAHIWKKTTSAFVLGKKPNLVRHAVRKVEVVWHIVPLYRSLGALHKRANAFAECVGWSAQADKYALDNDISIFYQHMYQRDVEMWNLFFDEMGAE